ncbi:TPA: cystatin-like fold lipoprotein, partial [Staphylococcus aureus]|nr:cystatin-like fold lipoprotein [Staphylococcus aureus]HDE0652769.1 cystatin-like fold lipoprotein [Staphylococcus aureus]
ATYEFKNDKIYYKRDINPKTYVKEHKSDYKDIKVK